VSIPFQVTAFSTQAATLNFLPDLSAVPVDEPSGEGDSSFDMLNNIR
jgi:hypothetical protein